jgi:catechol 2,3-dioxygenase-like lactoylglutathione lyase family enzyme
VNSGLATTLRGVNHVALRVRDVETSAGFYKGMLEFTEDVDRPMGIMGLLGAPRSTNHHDLGIAADRAGRG